MAGAAVVVAVEGAPVEFELAEGVVVTLLLVTARVVALVVVGGAGVAAMHIPTSSKDAPRSEPMRWSIAVVDVLDFFCSSARVKRSAIFSTENWEIKRTSVL